jgi:DNA-directed RNA polymerase subunit B'
VVPNDIIGQGLSALLSQGVLLMVDANETRLLRTTHDPDKLQPGHYLEISDTVFVGLIPSLSPFYRHNQGPRLAYWCGMAKQQICGGSGTDKCTTTEHRLWYAQNAILKTKSCELMRMGDRRDFVNATIAIFALPRNQEDAVVIHRASVERGMFVSVSTKTYVGVGRGTGSEFTDDKFERSGASVIGRGIGKDTQILDNGLPKVGAKIREGDVVIGLNAPTKMLSKSGQKVRRDRSVHAKRHTSGEVVSTFIHHDKHASLAKVSVSQVEYPNVGDKVSSRHAQKGTIGELRSTENMIFSAKTGMIPDIVMLPQGNFSRMTMGKILEILGAKASCVSGERVTDDQIFRTKGQERVRLFGKMLQQHGFRRDGTELMVDGITGETISSPIYTGVVSYTKLYHMVRNKIHARSVGPTNWITRQPTEGRRRGGGLRLGLMELDCLVAHGAAETIRERMYNMSSPSHVFICRQCGNEAVGNESKNCFMCSLCGSGAAVCKLKQDHVTKLFCQEIQAIGVKTTLGLKKAQ